MELSELGKEILKLKRDAITFVCGLDKPSYEEDADETTRSETRNELRSFLAKKKKEKSDFLTLILKVYNFDDTEKNNLRKFMITDSNAIETARLLLRKKFDFEFEKEQLVESLDTPKEYSLDTSKFMAYAITDTNIIKYFIFGIQSANKQIGFQSDSPVYGDVMGYHLIKLDKNKCCLEVKGGKYGYKKITGQIKKGNPSVNVIYNIEKSVLDKDFFTNILKSLNFRVLGLNYGSKKELKLNIYSSKRDVGSISNSFLLFSDEIDLLNFNEIQMEYSDTKNELISCDLRLERNYSAGYYELRLYAVSDSEQKKLIMKKIKEHFGVEIDKKYSLYQGYYLLKLFGAYNRKFWWTQINNSPLNFKKVISTLTSMNLITELKKGVRLDRKGLSNYLYSCIDKIKVYRRDDFAIEDVFLEDGLVRFQGFFTEKKIGTKRLFSFAVTFGDSINNSLSYLCLDWYKILTTNLDNEKDKQELLFYFFNKLKFHNLVESSFFNNKSIESYRLLSNVKETIHSYEDATLRGKIFERAVNDLLLGIYPHYLPLGKDEYPDGLLYFKGGKILLVLDAKSKKKVESSDIDEMIRYLRKDYFETDIVTYDDKIGVYVIDEKLIKSLDFRVLAKRMSKENLQAAYISSNFLTKYFLILRENLTEILLNPTVLESCSAKIIEMIKENSSVNLKPSKDSKSLLGTVLENEKKCLSAITKCVSQNASVVNEIENFERK